MTVARKSADLERRKTSAYERNTKFSSCQRRHEERRWNFYNDTFCARDYFRGVPAGIERGGGARFSAFARAAAGNEFAPRHHVLPAFFFHATRRWLANVENMLWKLAYGGVLLSVTYQRGEGLRDLLAKPQGEFFLYRR